MTLLQIFLFLQSSLSFQRLYKKMLENSQKKCFLESVMALSPAWRSEQEVILPYTIKDISSNADFFISKARSSEVFEVYKKEPDKTLKKLRRAGSKIIVPYLENNEIRFSFLRKETEIKKSDWEKDDYQTFTIGGFQGVKNMVSQKTVIPAVYEAIPKNFFFNLDTNKILTPEYEFDGNLWLPVDPSIFNKIPMTKNFLIPKVSPVI